MESFGQLAGLLKEVSRSFYLSIRFLPSQTRWQIALTYALARAADTVADTELVPAADRERALKGLASVIAEPAAGAHPRWTFSGQVENPFEKRLLEELPALLRSLQHLEIEDRACCQRVLKTLIEGMLWDLEVFGTDTGGLRQLASVEELDRYTYLVAGCVGEFWTRLHHRHRPALHGLDVEKMVDWGISLGEGLQLVNILRDCPRDLARGRCYLPADSLEAFGLKREALRSWPSPPGAQALLDHMLDRACAHFLNGWRYVDALPAEERLLKLCTVWPLLLGLRTIERLRRDSDLWLSTKRRLKVARRDVYGMMAWSALGAFSRGVLWRLFLRDFRRAGERSSR